MQDPRHILSELPSLVQCHRLQLSNLPSPINISKFLTFHHLFNVNTSNCMTFCHLCSFTSQSVWPSITYSVSHFKLSDLFNVSISNCITFCRLLICLVPVYSWSKCLAVWVSISPCCILYQSLQCQSVSLSSCPLYNFQSLYHSHF